MTIFGEISTENIQNSVVDNDLTIMFKPLDHLIAQIYVKLLLQALCYNED